MNKSSLNNLIGFGLLAALFAVYVYINQPSEAQIAEQQRLQDSTALAPKVNPNPDTLKPEGDSTPEANTATETTTATTQPVLSDSLQQLMAQMEYGVFASASQGTEEEAVLENELMKITFSNKGGSIKSVQLKKYEKLDYTDDKEEVKTPLFLLEDKKNKFEYLLPVANAKKGTISTGDLYFTADKAGESITYKVSTPNGAFIQKYTLKGDYGLDYNVSFEGLNGVLSKDKSVVELNWENYLDKIEYNTAYERNYSTVYYKESEDDPDNCSCTGDDTVEKTKDKVNWVSHSNQFFNSTLMSKDGFSEMIASTQVFDEDSEDMKKITTKLAIPYNQGASETFAMEFYIGPNKFETLQAYNNDLEDIIPYGWSIFGTINRWIIRPLFGFLSSFIGGLGMVILLMTFIVKAILYPLTYKMLYSQSKMQALKPEIAKIKQKVKGDAQQQQIETMKLYRETGTSPLGGCLPIVIQMPIWFALYRFFPASIDFRQVSFLWANDLSSFDIFTWLPTEIPFYGEHLSLFTLLWAGTTVIYTFYNSKHMDYSAQPAMQYVQYFMPIMFLFFFNNFAAGLTCYLFFSNVFNILQTVVTKSYIIDQDKVLAELEANKKKPKKQGGFQARLQEALKEQQRVAKDKDEKKKK